MKKITLLLFMLSFTWFSFAQVGLNTITPDASSALDIESTTGGILIPRLSESQRDAIALPATGLMIYQTDKNPGFYFYSGTSWTKINGATGPQGVFGGASFEYKYGGIGPLLSDVDNGLVRFLDSDTQNSAIQLQFSELDINGSSVFSFIEMLSQTQSTTKGVVRLVDKLDSSKNLQFKITNIDFTNATGSSAPGYFIFDVENVASSSSNPFSDFASYTPVVMTYSISGSDGLQGPQGSQGDQGIQGEQGPEGLQGIQGNQGEQGIQGPIGLTGLTGPSGQDGANGINGVDGAQGQTGATGPQGPQGEQGIQGIQGPIGLTGVTGPSGQDGANGIDGGDGPQGQTGATGPQGPQGEQGIQGIQGPIGLTGVTGPSGQDGANGIDGVDGAQGQTGATGPQGIQGEQGIQGAQGPIGLTGVTGPSGQDGADGIDGVDGEDGAQGPTGTTGPQGAQGEQGIQGPIGLTGPAGQDGADGIDGIDGAQGPTGPTGLQGPQGIVGPDGQSAYQIWLSRGNTGTEADFIASLTGPTGATGPQGAQGEQGVQGPIGVTGPSGQDGANGIDGVDGAQGQTGATGPQGSQGEQGVQGPIGLTGLTGPQGDQGEDSTVPGPSGPQGETGPAGATGVAGPTGPPGSQGAPGNDGIDGENGEDGLSAYEIWINAGNTGSEADFLASLTGPAGADGVDGSFPVANNQGDMLYWDGNEWALIENGQTGNILYFCDGVPKWGPCDGGEDPADPADPQIESESALAYEPNNFVRFNNIPQYDNLSSITVEFWVFKNNHQDEHIIGTEYYDTGWSVNGQTNNSIAKLGGLSVPNSSEVFIPLGEWVHIVLQYDGSLSENNIKFFINGEIKYQESGFPDEIGDGGSIAINRHSWNGGVSSRLSGKLDEVRISNIARYSENFTPSTNQLQNDNNTLLLLNFETTSSSSNQVIDSSDFQNHGNVTGEISYTPRN